MCPSTQNRTEGRSGDVIAQASLGRRLLLAGDAQGAAWLCTAAQNGDTLAMFDLSTHYAEGSVVTRNWVEAWAWLKLHIHKARDNVVDGAIRMEYQLAGALSPDELKEVKEIIHGYDMWFLRKARKEKAADLVQPSGFMETYSSTAPLWQGTTVTETFWWNDLTNFGRWRAVRNGDIPNSVMQNMIMNNSHPICPTTTFEYGYLNPRGLVGGNTVACYGENKEHAKSYINCLGGILMHNWASGIFSAELPLFP